MNRFFKFFIVATLCIPLPGMSAELPTLAAVDFDSSSSRHRHLGRQMADLITDAVVNSGLFDVVERDKLSSVVAEQGFSGSGMVDPEHAIKMGALVGADYLLTGRIISADVSNKTFSGYGVRTVKTTTSMKASARVMDAKTGRIVFSATESASSNAQSNDYIKGNEVGSFSALAQQIANKFAQKLDASGKFVPEEKKETPMAKVNITSSPEMADVEVDGVFFGNAGGEVEVPAGLHSMKISLPGYEVWEKKVMLKDGQNIRATLRKAADVRITHEATTSITEQAGMAGMEVAQPTMPSAGQQQAIE